MQPALDAADPETHAAGVRVTRHEGIVTVTFDHPARRNALTVAGWRRLGDVVRSIDPVEDRVVILRGAEGHFCSGADVADEPTGEHSLDEMRDIGATCLALHRLPLPTIACVEGVAVGAGMNVALACDFVIAARGARFSQIFIQRALTVDFGGSWILPRLVGLHRAKELVLLGDIWDADALADFGIACRVVEPGALEDTVQELATRLAAVPRIAFAQSKALLNGSFEISLDRALDEEGRAQALNMVGPDVEEAFAAFLEKRAPHYARHRPSATEPRTPTE